MLETAAPMIQDYFPAVTAAAAAGFVGILSLDNMAGRFVWSTTSDYIGRKPMYMIYLGVGVLLYLLIALVGDGSLILFVSAAIFILSSYGGGFSPMPGCPRARVGH